MTDPTTRLNAALEARYRIEREIGEGGMATVYLADDLKHERKVALKVLKPELAAVVGLRHRHTRTSTVGERMGWDVQRRPRFSVSSPARAFRHLHGRERRRRGIPTSWLRARPTTHRETITRRLTVRLFGLRLPARSRMLTAVWPILPARGPNNESAMCIIGLVVDLPCCIAGKLGTNNRRISRRFIRGICAFWWWAEV